MLALGGMLQQQGLLAGEAESRSLNAMAPRAAHFPAKRRALRFYKLNRGIFSDHAGLQRHVERRHQHLVSGGEVHIESALRDAGSRGDARDGRPGDAMLGHDAYDGVDDLPGAVDADRQDRGELEELQAAFAVSRWAARSPLEVEVLGAAALLS